MNRLKLAGLAILGLFTVVALPLVFFLGAAALAKALLPHLGHVTVFCLAVFLLLVVPLSLSPGLRPRLGAAAFLLSFLYGGAVWMISLALLLDYFSTHFWIVLTVSVLFVFFGGGFSTLLLPASVVSATVGDWGRVGHLALAFVMIAVMRIYAVWLVRQGGKAAAGPSKGFVDVTGYTVDERDDPGPPRSITEKEG